MLVPAPARGQPDNTLKARVKVLDIGLGRALFDDGEVGGGELTTPGESLGTPDYMAPEQARDAHTADVRADIYSLGCVLYHCLTGQVPFPARNPVQKLLAHATQTPRPLKELNPAVPDGLQPILDGMLAKDPAQRYPTPDRATRALKVFLTTAEDAPEKPPPQMDAFLNWLETREGPRRSAAVPPPLPPPPAVAPVAAPKGRSIPPPLPAPPAIEAAPVAEKELVSAAHDWDTPPPEGISRREWILLGFGAAALLLLGLVVWLILRPH
jgi:serine/threonine protein kinase